MNYHPDDFLSLIEHVEDQGGVHLASETCKPTQFRLNQPIDIDRPRGPKASRKFETTGCHRRAKFLVSFLPEAYFFEKGVGHEDDFDFDDDSNPNVTTTDGSPALAKVCAVDDAMGLWPRFRDAIHTGESFQE